MTKNEITAGTKVLVPQHFKPRGTARVYDTGTVQEVEGGMARVNVEGRTVHCPVGILSRA